MKITKKYLLKIIKKELVLLEGDKSDRKCAAGDLICKVKPTEWEWNRFQKMCYAKKFSNCVSDPMPYNPGPGPRGYVPTDSCKNLTSRTVAEGTPWHDPGAVCKWWLKANLEGGTEQKRFIDWVIDDRKKIKEYNKGVNSMKITKNMLEKMIREELLKEDVSLSWPENATWEQSSPTVERLMTEVFVRLQAIEEKLGIPPPAEAGPPTGDAMQAIEKFKLPDVAGSGG